MKVAILGSTGSIGTQGFEVVEDLRGIKDIEVVGISGNKNLKLLEEQIRKFHVPYAAVPEEKDAKTLATAVADTDCKVLSGQEGLCFIAAETGADMLLSAIVGFSGMVPTMKAIEAGIDIALANKETLVTAGFIFMDAVAKHQVRLLPVDSEHSAIFQSLHGGKRKELSKILLTASGGPFYGKTRDELEKVTLAQALKHPNWSMGAKITIDSATLMNKGLEVIEAKWLFDVAIDDVEVVVQRESIIHSMVEFCDHSVIAQLGLPSMKHPIQYAFTYPERLPAKGERISFGDLGKLSFGKPDEETFRCLALAKEAGRREGIMPTIMNAANEVAVGAFLQEKIGFLEIADFVEKTMRDFDNIPNPTIDDLLEADASVRERGI